MGDDYFFTPAPQPATPPAPVQQPAAAWPVQTGPMGYPYGAPPPPPSSSQPFVVVVPRTPTTTLAAVAAAAALLMVVGAWGTWMKMSFAGLGGRGVGGLNDGLDGRYMLGLGLVALLCAGVAMVSQSSPQARQWCAWALIGIGVIGFVVVVHEWLHISHLLSAESNVLKSLGSAFGNSSTTPTTPGGTSASDFGAMLGSLFSEIHISKGWGLVLSGISSAVTAFAGLTLVLL